MSRVNRSPSYRDRYQDTDSTESESEDEHIFTININNTFERAAVPKRQTTLKSNTGPRYNLTNHTVAAASLYSGSGEDGGLRIYTRTQDGPVTEEDTGSVERWL
jgi:hypothetical protein